MSENGFDCVVTHHLNRFGSGVARFNEILAEGLGVPLVWLFDPRLAEFSRPLLSFKVGEMREEERAAVDAILDGVDWEAGLFVHDYHGLPLEQRLVRIAARVYCGNHEVLAQVRGLSSALETLWSPGLILDARLFRPARISVFSFGMAHKIRTDMFQRLRELLEGTGQPYVIYVSAANHESASLQDAKLIFDEMSELFPDELYFMGNLSDVAVYNYLQSTTYFASFFDRGVRANNGSIAAAMEHGAVAITNLDELSPPEFVHMDNVIDINQADALPADPLLLRRISVRAMETARSRSWAALVDCLRPGPGGALPSAVDETGVGSGA